MANQADASRAQQPRRFPVEESPPWPRRLAIALTLFVWLIPPATGIITTIIADSGFAIVGAATIWVPWAWAAPKLVRFMLTGVEDWELPYHRFPRKLSPVDDD